jgi:hypothetical protein
MNNVKQMLYLIPLLGMMVACSNDATIQTYYIDKSQSSDFISIDLPTSLFTANADLTADERKTLDNLKKLNLLAFQVSEENQDMYYDELTTVQEILTNKKYSSLVTYNQGNQKIEFFAQENKDAIKEYIVFAHDNKLGFMVARVLGNNLDPNHMYEMMKLSDKLEMSALEDFAKQIDLPNSF